MDDKISDARMT